MARDRLGSSRMGGSKYYPYGEEQQVTAQDKDKFGTYYRDGTTGLDYAKNRYYANTLGRFTSPDPYAASGGPRDPQSWNRYAYTAGDPVNLRDPEGLRYESAACGPDWVSDASLGGPCEDDWRRGEAAPGGGGALSTSDILSGAAQSFLGTVDSFPMLEIRWTNWLALADTVGQALASSRIPAFLQLNEDCWTVGPNGLRSRRRTYQILDQNKQVWSSTTPAAVNEYNAVLGGPDLTSKNAIWGRAQLTFQDYIGAPLFGVTHQHQFFYSYGFPSLGGAAVPLRVQTSMSGAYVPYLDIYQGFDGSTKSYSVNINGDRAQNIGDCKN
jgi:RHS repeat-associated protein